MTADSDFQGVDEQRLSRLFAVEELKEDSWSDDEVASIFRHQLTVSLQEDLDDSDHAAAGPTHETFGELLRHPKPSAESLDLVKGFAKRSAEGTSCSLPKDVAGLLYVLAISAALVRTDRRLSSLSDISLGARIDWALSVSWLDDDFRDLLQAAQRKLG